MIRREEFHAIRLSALIPGREQYAREQALRLLVACHGKDAIKAMSEAERERQLSECLELEADITDESVYWMEVSFNEGSDEGLTLYYDEEDRLVRLDANLTPEDFVNPSPFAALSDPTDHERERSNMDALKSLGWPLDAGVAWQEAGPILRDHLESIVVTRWRRDDDSERRTVRGSAGGLYYVIHFCDDNLVSVEITDVELTRQARIAYLDCMIKETREDDPDDDEAIESYEGEKAELSVLDLSTFEQQMEYIDDLPLEAEVEYMSPALTRFAKPRKAPADGRPQWIKELSEGQAAELQQFYLNTDVAILPKLSAAQSKVSSLAELEAVRDELMAKPEVQEKIKEMEAEIFPLHSRLSPTGIANKVRKAIKHHFGLGNRYSLGDEETIREDLGADEDDRHLLRSMISVGTGVRMGSAHWDAIVTVGDLIETVQYLREHPEEQRHEPVPASAMARQTEGLKQTFQQSSDAVADLFKDFSKRLAEDVEQLRDDEFLQS